MNYGGGGGGAVLDRPMTKGRTSYGNNGDDGDDGGDSNNKGPGGGGGGGNGDYGSDDYNRGGISVNEKYTTMGSVSKYILRQILPPQLVEKMMSNPMTSLRNIQLVRDILLDTQNPFKIAWDLQT